MDFWRIEAKFFGFLGSSGPLLEREAFGVIEYLIIIRNNKAKNLNRCILIRHGRGYI